MNAEEICAAASARRITQKDAQDRLVALGYESADAAEQIFIALGGDDVVEDDTQRATNSEIGRLE